MRGRGLLLLAWAMLLSWVMAQVDTRSSGRPLQGPLGPAVRRAPGAAHGGRQPQAGGRGGGGGARRGQRRAGADGGGGQRQPRANRHGPEGGANGGILGFIHDQLTAVTGGGLADLASQTLHSTAQSTGQAVLYHVISRVLWKAEDYAYAYFYGPSEEDAKSSETPEELLQMIEAIGNLTLLVDNTKAETAHWLNEELLQIRNAAAQASAGTVPVAALADAIRKELDEVIRPAISSLAAAQDQNGKQVAELRAHLEASLGAEAAENRKRLEAMCAAMEDFAEASANKAAALEHKFDTALKWMGRNLEDKFSSGLEEVLDTVRAVEVKVPGLEEAVLREVGSLQSHFRVHLERQEREFRDELKEMQAKAVLLVAVLVLLSVPQVLVFCWLFRTMRQASGGSRPGDRDGSRRPPTHQPQHRRGRVGSPRTGSGRRSGVERPVPAPQPCTRPSLLRDSVVKDLLLLCLQEYRVPRLRLPANAPLKADLLDLLRGLRGRCGLASLRVSSSFVDLISALRASMFRGGLVVVQQASSAVLDLGGNCCALLRGGGRCCGLPRHEMGVFSIRPMAPGFLAGLPAIAARPLLLLLEGSRWRPGIIRLGRNFSLRRRGCVQHRTRDVHFDVLYRGEDVCTLLQRGEHVPGLSPVLHIREDVDPLLRKAMDDFLSRTRQQLEAVRATTNKAHNDLSLNGVGDVAKLMKWFNGWTKMYNNVRGRFKVEDIIENGLPQRREPMAVFELMAEVLEAGVERYDLVLPRAPLQVVNRLQEPNRLELAGKADKWRAAAARIRTDLSNLNEETGSVES